jgi:hypothetical protein
MTPDVQILASGALTFGVPLLIAARELLLLDRRGGAGERDDEPLPAPVPPAPDLEPSPRPLPACLIPAPRAMPARRVPELV